MQAQTLTARTQSYPLTDYEDSNYALPEEAIAAGVVDAYDTKSFRIKLLSKSKSTYSDSRGARLPCKERPTVTICSASFPVENTNCITKLTYIFRVNVRKRLIAASFEELFSCEDGIFLYSQHSGVSTFSVKRR
jgi:hypothetical protein